MLKQGKIFWFKSDVVTPDSPSRGIIEVGTPHLTHLLSSSHLSPMIMILVPGRTLQAPLLTRPVCVRVCVAACR